MSDQTPPPGPGQPVSGPTATTRPGELLDRFLARLIDGVLLAVVNGVIVTALVVGAIMGDSGGMYGTGSDYAAAAVSSVLTAAIYLGVLRLPRRPPGARPSARW